MNRFIIMIGIMVLLSACTSEGKSETKEGTNQDKSSSLVIKPAELTEREESLVTQMGVDHKTFYTVSGKLGKGDVVVSSVIVYEADEEPKEKIVSISRTGDAKEFDGGLHSFQVLLEEKETYLTLGNPKGYARGTTTMPKDLRGYRFDSFEEDVTVTKGTPLYLSYLIGTSQNQLTGGGFVDQTVLPETVKEAEYALVFKVEIREESELYKDKEEE
ncbi:hypothetical protein LCL89_09340 [Halobacillus yeomjeoni]|uniref:hypothetical protein n=1 Tax=Halobacillus yeomjeoni TaxID=311194 RepID=UPI001CD4D776|nr:hypothetical protein [Halobacillus yeomjeoni]MCA0984247.1 hypothetical protein [Halobacillus yeomjeoni]